MKRNEAQDLIAFMRAATSGQELDASKQAFWEGQLIGLDADQATQAVHIGIRSWKFFPSWADFATIYTDLHKLGLAEAEAQQRKQTNVQREIGLPFWIKRFACARYLYARFDREQDFRRFAEQGDAGDLREELMPDDEWVKEAETISDHEAWRSVSGGQR